MVRALRPAACPLLATRPACLPCVRRIEKQLVTERNKSGFFIAALACPTRIFAAGCANAGAKLYHLPEYKAHTACCLLTHMCMAWRAHASAVTS